MDKHGPGLTLFDPSGLKRVDIRGDDDGYSRIQIYGKGDAGKGLPLAEMGVLEGKDPSIELSTNHLKGPQLMAYASQGHQAVSLFTNEGRRWLSVGLDRSGQTILQVFDKSGRPMYPFPAAAARPDEKK